MFSNAFCNPRPRLDPCQTLRQDLPRTMTPSSSVTDARQRCVRVARSDARSAVRSPWPAGALALAALLLAGCASTAGIDPVARPIAPVALGLASAPGDATLAPAENWWRALGAPQLDRLVEQALAGSPTLGQAQARLARAQALAAGTQAGAGPQVNGALDVTTQRFSANSLYPPPLAGSVKTTGNAQVNANWEFDFFGRNQAAIAAAAGQQRAAEAEVAAARVLLASQVVRGYVQVGHLQALRAVAQRSHAQREQMRDLIRQRVQAGLDTAVEARQGELALPEARLQIEQIDEQLALARHALALLSAQRLDALDALDVDLSRLMPMALPDTVGADLLGRRADIVAARWRVEAAGSDIQAARAQFYPNVNLVAFIGLSSLGLDRFLQGSSTQWGVGPAVRLPIFDSGRLRANLAARTADLDGAIESYNATVRGAARDALDQIASLQSLARQQQEQAQVQAGARAAFDLIRQRYGAGLSTYLAVLQAETQLLAQQRLAADLAARVLDTQAALVRALGGGYAAGETPWSQTMQAAVRSAP